MKIENMKAVVEFIRFKYYFKKEINNEIMREISQNHSKKCYLLSAFKMINSILANLCVLSLHNCRNKTVRLTTLSYPYI